MTDFEKLIPMNIEAEKCALASALLDKSMLAELRGIIGADDFVLPECAAIWRCICAMADGGRVVDAVALRAELIRLKKIDEIGGVAFVGEILNTVPNPANGPHYAAIVRRLSIYRGMIDVANRLARIGYEQGSGNPEEDISGVIADLVKLTSEKTQACVTKLIDACHEYVESLDNPEKRELIQTGYRDLDRQIGGIARGEMVVIGAFPSVGKSTLGRQISIRSGAPCGIISLEESADKHARNQISAAAEIENTRIRRADLNRDEIGKVVGSLPVIDGYPVFIVDRAFNMRAIRSACATLVAKHRVKLVIVDYLQKINGHGNNEFERVTNISMDLNRMFKELNVAGIVLSQLNREAMKRDDHRPRMSDLRQSGQIEADADGVLFLHREDYFHLEDASYQPNHEAEIIIAKWRDSVRGKIIKLRSNLRYQRFDDLD